MFKVPSFAMYGVAKWVSQMAAWNFDVCANVPRLRQ